MMMVYSLLFRSTSPYHVWNKNVINYLKNLTSKQFSTQLSLRCANKSTSSQISIRKRSTVYYLSAACILTVGLSYAAVPLYRMFCQAYSYGGTVGESPKSPVEDLKKVKHREITVKFNADVNSKMQWNFEPQQREIKIFPGETALAFYTAYNPSDKQVVGISTYNVVPFDAGQYFNKIQCFCFEEQMLNPHEQVDMPVFFYIDSEFAEDPDMENVSEITLSYTFFEAKPGLQLPIPSFVKSHLSQKSS